MDLDNTLGAILQRRKLDSLYRNRGILESPQSARIIIDGKSKLAFSSNDYLGLSNHPDLISAMKTAVDTYGVGSGASHLISGHCYEHHALEEELATFCNRPRALLFSTGYMANLGVISALVSKGDGVFEDRLNHASLLDGGLLSGARFQRYTHNDARALSTRLQKTDCQRKLVNTDGVFSMDGDLADLPALAATCQQHDAWLMVDDAHGFGVLGPHGGGIAEHYQLSAQQLPILMGTLGKAFGTFGAFVAGSETLIEYLIQFSRSYIYTTALPPAIAAASRASLKLVQREGWRREKLQALISQFRQGAKQLGLELMASQTPIQPVLVGDDSDVVKVGELLGTYGLHVGTIRSPTVPKGTARLRITLNANHSEKDVSELLEGLDKAFQSLSLRTV